LVFTARCYVSAVLAMGLCPSVCLCQCLSQAGVLLQVVQEKVTSTPPTWNERSLVSLGFALEKNLRNLSAIQSLNYIYQHSLIDLYYPNTAIALRLLTTLPVTVASCERSFSKLKLIKTYQRNTMAQEKTSRFIGHFNRTRDLQIGGYLRACWSVRQLEGKEVLFWCAFNISPFHHWSASMLCLLYLYLVILYMVH